MLHPVFGPGEDRNRSLDQPALGGAELHPVFGPGEDRNGGRDNDYNQVTLRCTRSSDRVRIATPGSPPTSRPGVPLHPVFGPGEDRNLVRGETSGTWDVLHPVFGPGEDRNATAPGGAVTITLAAPGLRTG